MIGRRGALASILLLAGAVAPAHADRASHDEARKALERGEVKPLAEILARVQPELGGEVISVDLERRHGSWIYEFRVIAPDGRRREIYVDATTAAVRRVRERDER